MPIFRSQSALIYFAHIPKTGGSSVENALFSAGAKRAMQISKSKNTEINYGKCTPQHIHANVYKSYFPDGFFDYEFTLVRNPFSRLASEYKMKVVDGNEQATPDVWISKALKRYEKIPFTRDNHIRPQADFLMPDIDIFKLEEGLDTPINKALSILGLPSTSRIPHARKSTVQTLEISKKTLNLIKDTYAHDFLKLGYDYNSYNQHFNVS